MVIPLLIIFDFFLKSSLNENNSYFLGFDHGINVEVILVAFLVNGLCLEKQAGNKTASDLRIKIKACSNQYWVSKAILSTLAQDSPWGSQVADKKRALDKW